MMETLGRVTRSQGGAINPQKEKKAASTSEHRKEARSKTDLSDVAYLEALKPDKEVARHPVEVGRILFQAGFGACKEITKVGKFRFKLNLLSINDLTKLEKTDLKKYNLTMYSPRITKETILFVRNVPLDFDADDLKQYTQCDSEVIKVERIKRKGAGETLINTPNLKNTVMGNEIPKTLKIYGVNFRTELYIFPVKQCNACWRFGHTRKVCRSNARCQNCGELECDERDCKKQTRCVNCSQNHQAGDRTCPERSRRYQILHLMAEKRVAYEEAAKEWPITCNRYAGLEEDEEPYEPTTSGPFLFNYGGKRQRRNLSRSGTTEVERSIPEATFAGLFSAANSIRSQPRGRLAFENGQKATEFERCIAELRRLFLQSHSSFTCTLKIQGLSDKITRKLQQTSDGIESDQLLIQISSDLNDILNPEAAAEKIIQIDTEESSNGE